MDSNASRKKTPGRPALTTLERQRRLVARLHENCAQLERLIVEEAGYETTDASQHAMLLSTYFQRMNFAREAAMLEHQGQKEEAKAVRQKLNLFRPLGLTEETWNSLPETAKRLAPGKPKMPKELELARLELERDAEIIKLRELETESGEAPADLGSLQERHGQTATGRPGRDILGVLDRQMHIAIYKRRDLLTREESEPKPNGRPRKPLADRYNYFTTIIEHCHNQILDLEAKLPLLDLQKRLVKLLRDKATRLRIDIGGQDGPELVTLKLDLLVVEEQIADEAERLKDLESRIENMADTQLESLRKSVALKISNIDSAVDLEKYEDKFSHAN